MDDFGKLDGAAASLEFLTTDVPDTSASSPEVVVRFLVNHLVGSGLVANEHADTAVRNVMARERLGSTGLGHGLAFPHATGSFVKVLVGVLGRCRIGIPWDSLDGKDVYRVCLLLAPANQPHGHLRTLERLNKALRRQT